jgi:hypothetical protein
VDVTTGHGVAESGSGEVGVDPGAFDLDDAGGNPLGQRLLDNVQFGVVPELPELIRLHRGPKRPVAPETADHPTRPVDGHEEQRCGPAVLERRAVEGSKDAVRPVPVLGSVQVLAPPMGALKGVMGLDA